jgi:RNA polymerase sigma-70 factor (ECF subfamily)
VRQFFALANQHMRWELNDLARRLDEQPPAVELHAELVPEAASSASALRRRLNRGLKLLTEKLRDLRPDDTPPDVH